MDVVISGAQSPIRYQLWCRSATTNQPDRWHAQFVADTYEELAPLVARWRRTYPHHEVAILPSSGSFPITVADWQRVATTA
jgi:hypothetical protein